MNQKMGVVGNDQTQLNANQDRQSKVSDLTKGSKNSGSAHIADDKHNTCRLAIVDSRQCLRDALAESFGQQLSIPVSVYDSLNGLIASDNPLGNTTTLILQLPAGSSRPELESDISALREWDAEVKIVLLVDKLTREVVDICRALGISGLVSSEYSSGQILVCVSVVESGLCYFPADIEPQVVTNNFANDDIANVQLPNLDGTLTPRQQQVMRYIAIGKSNKYIAAELSLCESTVKVHVSEVMRRLGATSRTHASYIINQLESKHQVLT